MMFLPGKRDDAAGRFYPPGSREWAAAVLRHVGERIGVRRTHVVNLDVGTTTRMRLSVEHIGPEDVPTHWFTKLPSLSWKARRASGFPRAFEREVKMYRHVLADLPVETPRCLFGASRGRGRTLVLEDLTHYEAQTRLAGDVLTVDEAHQAVVTLAKFHAALWASERFAHDLSWLRHRTDDANGWVTAVLRSQLCKQGLKRSAPRLSSKLNVMLGRWFANRAEAKTKLHGDSVTLVHGDCHAGHLYWRHGVPGFVDWQNATCAEGIGDVASLLVTSLETQERREEERSLVESYAETLRSQGVVDARSDLLWERYRLHTVGPLERLLIASSLSHSNETKGEVVQRSHQVLERLFIAVEDHDSLSRVLS